MTFPTVTTRVRFDKTSQTWTDISDYVELIQIRHGRQRFLERHQPGRVTLRLDNSDGRFDPANLSGPYVSGGVTQVRPMVQALVTATVDSVDHHLKLGFVDSWRARHDRGGGSQVDLVATDGFKLLALQQVTSTYGGPGIAARQINHLFPTSAWLTPNGVTAEYGVQQATIQTLTPSGQNVLTLMQQIADTDRGDLYMRPREVGGIVFDGLVFKPYWYRQTAESQGTFTDDPGAGEWDWEELPSYDSDDAEFVTKVVGQRTGGAEISESSTAALAANLDVERIRSNTQLLHETDDDVTTWVAGVLHRFGEFTDYFPSITLNPGAVDDDDLWTAVCSHWPGTRITVTKNTGYSVEATRDCFIEGVEHIIDPGGGGVGSWRTRWSLSDAERFPTDVLVLDSVTRGKLDTGRLGF